MRNERSWKILVLGSMLILGIHAAGQNEVPFHRRTFSDCFFYKGPDGQVWIGQPLVALGMIGVNGSPPTYRLSPPLAEKFQPLVTDLKEIPKEPPFWFWGLPKVRGSDKPFVLIRLEAEAHQRKKQSNKSGRPFDEFSRTPLEYEIVSGELVCVEFLQPAWRQAWDNLDRMLKAIVAISRMAPGPLKQVGLQGAIEQASQALGSMDKSRLTAESRNQVARISPQARVVRNFQRQINSQWGAQLRLYIDRLRLAPSTPLIPEPRPCPLRELLVDSHSPAEFQAKIRQSWPEETFDEVLVFSQSLKRVVFVWQVAGFTPEQFNQLRNQAREELARQEKEKRRSPTEPRASSEDVSVSIPFWRVVLRPAGQDLLAEKGFLQGTLVEKVTADNPPEGLQAGDIIIDYDSVYDLVMAAYPTFGPINRLKNMARYGGKLVVLRGQKIITLVMEKP